jgi:hypothetical protein
MPPERHSPPPARPPRDRHGGGGPGFGGPRRSFGPPREGGGFGGPRDSGPRPPFTPRPLPPPAEPLHTVRIREGEREVEVSGTADFVRHTLDDLPSLLARFHGEAAAPSRPASISMPPPPRAAAQSAAAHDDTDDDDTDADADEDAPNTTKQPATGHRRDRHVAASNGKNGAVKGGSLEDRVFTVLQRAAHPLSVAAIRQQLGGDSSGQQIRRILERASDRVVATDERPAAYALR